MDTEVVKCAEMVRVGGHGWRALFKPCDKRGTLEHEGRLWCKTHHPPTREAKQEVRHAKWDAKLAADKREREQKARDAADIVKFRALAKRAYEAHQHEEADSIPGITRELAEMHKETP